MRTHDRIGYTTGVFDLFHIGHLNLLRNARARCARLIVGVSTDEVVEAYKGRRPVIPFEERLAIVSAIRYVDQAVSQPSMDKVEAWRRLRYDVMFHGSDWADSTLFAEYETRLAEVGATVEFLPHTAGISTSALIGRTGREGYARAI